MSDPLLLPSNAASHSCLSEEVPAIYSWSTNAWLPSNVWLQEHAKAPVHQADLTPGRGSGCRSPLSLQQAGHVTASLKCRSTSVCLQLVAKWRAISSAQRSEGVHNFHQSIRQKAPPVDKTKAAKPAYKPVRPARPGDIVNSTQGQINRLYENGYIRPKMIRIRLLHYWICRLLGEQYCELYCCCLRRGASYAIGWP